MRMTSELDLEYISGPSEESETSKTESDTILTMIDRLDGVISELKSSCADNTIVEARSISCKLLSRASSKAGLRRSCSQIFSDNTVKVLLKIVADSTDVKVQSNVVLLLSECLNLKGINKHPHILCLLRHSGSQVLLNCLNNVQIGDSNYYAWTLHSLLAKVGVKDPHFAVTARKLGVIKITLNLLKMHVSSLKSASPYIKVAKLYCKSAKNCQFVCKEGFISYILSFVRKFNKRVSYTDKLTLDLLTQLSVSKCCCLAIIKSDGVPVLLSLLDSWKQIDLKMCGLLVTCLLHICRSKLGRKTLATHDASQVLLRLCGRIPDQEQYDTLLSRASNVLHSCHVKQLLPVEGPAFTFAYRGRDLQERLESEMFDSDSDDLEDACEDEPGTPEVDGENSTVVFPTKIIEEMIPDLSGVVSNEKLLPFKSFFPELQIPLENSSVMILKKQELGIDLESEETDRNYLSLYGQLSKRTNSVLPFVKFSYADGSSARLQTSEPLLGSNRNTYREKLMSTIQNLISPAEAPSRFIYDIDVLKDDAMADYLKGQLTNQDEAMIGKLDISDLTCSDHLKFESRFESGNLRKVFRTGLREYQLILNPDVNSTRNFQWFYFQVSNMDSNVPYTFNIINMEKRNSQYNEGMQPVMFSVIEAKQGRPAWFRTGSDICYYRNEFFRENASRTRQKSFFTTSFTITFMHSFDICYLAYHYPYTYTALKMDLYLMSTTMTRSNIFLYVDSLCTSLKGNPVPFLTITSPDNMSEKDYIVLTARVHPGETNSSWIMKGVLDTLLSDDPLAVRLRKMFIFKIVPMLNVDGVVNGCHRCGLTGEDLNRKWKSPDQIQNPEIYNIKHIIAYICKFTRSPPLLFCDFHGHSNRKNVFLFGCDKSKSWYSGDLNSPGPTEYHKLANALASVCPYFSLKDCNFSVRKNRESTARVTVWREFNVSMSYTMEATYCGCDSGAQKDFHLSIPHLLEVGRHFCQAILLLKDPQAIYSPVESQDTEASTPESRNEPSETGLEDGDVNK